MFGPVASAGRLIAHRGASIAAPENTLAAFAAAREAGAGWVEFDVSLLGDGTPVLHHDATLERCTDGQGALADSTAPEVAALDAGAWFGAAFAGEPVPLLDAALDWLGAAEMSANLEMKPHGAHPGPLAAAVAEALTARPWTAARILVSSFDHAALEQLKALMPRQPLAALYHTPPGDWLAQVRRLGAGAMHMDHRALTPAHLEAAEQAGLALRVFTANDPAALEPFRDLGLSGVITDDPAGFLKDAGWAAWARGGEGGKGG